MGQTRKIGTVHTKRGFNKDTGFYEVKYHNTIVVAFNDDIIVLDNGGYRTHTTKTRMMQTSNEFNLGFTVYQRAFEWFVDFEGITTPYTQNKMTLTRNLKRN